MTLLRTVLQFYKLTISPLLGNRCRFYPSCSEYCVQAIEGHGFFIGGWLAFKRVIKCHPFHPGGEDQVPPRLKAD